MRLRSLIISLVAVGLPPSLVCAGGWGFLPRPTENGAYLELFGSHERSGNRYEARSVRWNDTFFKEKLVLFTKGYVYHPRFFRYELSLGGALKQERFDFTPLGQAVRSNTSGFEYDARLLFLPDHPYNLELYGRRYEPLVKEQAAARKNSIETSRGALFRWRIPSWAVHARYTRDRFQTDGESSYVTRTGVDGEYFKRFRNGFQLSFSAAYNPSRFTNTSGLNGNTTDVVFGNFVDLRYVRLNSSLNRGTVTQEGLPGERFESTQYVWYEHLNAYLPWNLRSDLTWRYQDNDRTIESRTGVRDRQLSDTNRDLTFRLVHKLFQSLDTSYTYTRGDKESSGGEARTNIHALTVNYAKSIPHGRIIAGTNYSRAVVENNGRADVVNEQHPQVAVPGTFRLNEPNVVGASLSVFLKSPLAPYNYIQLTENIHYTVSPFGATLEIDILGLPPQFTLPGSYDFMVSYTLTSGDFELRTRTLASNATVELFDNHVAPYASYVAVRTDDLGGTYRGQLLDSTTTAAGVIVRFDGSRALGEYQHVDWTINPYRAWKFEVQHSGALGRTGNLYVKATWLNKHFPQGTTYGDREAHTDRSYSITANVQKQFFSRRMIVAVGGGFFRLQDRIDSRSYTATSSLTWKIGKLDLVAGANASRSDSDGLNDVTMRRSHQYYYLRLRRVLF